MIVIRRVVGKSMEPTLKEGQVVIAHQLRNFKPGQVVIAFIDGREVIKRITKIENNSIFLEGDNAAHSSDSRAYGPVVDTKIEAVVFWPKTSKQSE